MHSKKISKPLDTVAGGDGLGHLVRLGPVNRWANYRDIIIIIIIIIIIMGQLSQ